MSHRQKVQSFDEVVRESKIIFKKKKIAKAVFMYQDLEAVF